MRQFSASTAYETCESKITNMNPQEIDEKRRPGIFKFRTTLLLILTGFFIGHLISRDMLYRLYLHGPEVDDLPRVLARRRRSEDSSSAEGLFREDYDSYSM